jgi:hypothetical protein
MDEGDFFGWIEEVPKNVLLEEENWQESTLFNCKYLNSLSEQTTEFTYDASKRGFKYSMNRRRMMFGTTNSKTVINMYVNLIPKEWKLGDGEYPEKWKFKVVDGKILVEAQKLNLIHNKYPIVIGAPDFDGYSIAPVSRLEVISGLQEVLNFLFNSHVTNVRRAINNMFIVDPSLVNMPDFEDPSGGLLVRLRRSAWGRGVSDVVQQLSVTDVTASHIQQAFQVMDIGQRVTGATEGMMGMMRRGSERRSATEARSTMQNVMNRMERMAKVLSAQAMTPLAYMLAFHTQQLMNEETYVKIVGNWVDELRAEFGMDYKQGERVKVSPFDILVEFDIIPRDGSLPVDTTGAGQQWVELFQIMSQNPLVGQQFDMVRIFMHIARLMGAKNLHEFKAKVGQIQPQVMPDEEVAKQAQAGNLIQMPQAQAGAGV